MAFIKRLGYYLVGLSIGIIFLAIFFKKKSEETGVSFCYFPNCRTLKDIRSKPLSYSEEINQLILNKELDSIMIAAFLFDGDVDFSGSDTKSQPCKTYRIEGEVNEKEAVLTVRNCASKAVVEQITY
ncbi:DUF4258 domain-containing protein [Aggregatimonas sangjinii]|uniref:DUF4258 domain-containing protein n=1 Tax=Aggregatimonas sangjinii TaxID=2583587 RepID=A0A5B7SS15_9FLAO|nr:DUF4258 domain-containing protein [Aggregatimonas sangjinii]QCW99800.1 DUF4258 domain-containing protein [Aggregatimonas sangjinii]